MATQCVAGYCRLHSYSSTKGNLLCVLSALRSAEEDMRLQHKLETHPTRLFMSGAQLQGRLIPANLRNDFTMVTIE